MKFVFLICLRMSALFVYYSSISILQGGPQKMQKLNEYPTTKSVNYEFIRAWQIGKTSNIAALIIDVL